MTITGLDSINIAIWSVWAYIVAYLILVRVVRHRLKRHHVPTYKAIARPGLFGTDAIVTSWNMVQFITGREHAHLGDRTLSRLSDAALLALCASPVVFLAGAVYAVAAA
jgi:hypothetical protein